MANRDIRITLRDRQVSGGALPSNALMAEPFVNLFDGILKFSGVTGGGFEPSSTSSVFEVGSTLYNQRISNRLNINDNFIISGNTGFISTYGGTSGSGLVGKFLSGTTSGFVLGNISDIQGVTTRVQPGVNIYTGGTPDNPTVNLVDSPSINGLTASGTSNFTGTIQSGGTDLYGIFLTAGDLSGTTVSEGSNVTVQQTGVDYKVSVVGSPSFNQLTTSGVTTINSNLTVTGLTSLQNVSATDMSATTFYSASTNLETIIYNIVNSTELNDITRVQPGTNIITGGTANNPTVNLVDSPSVDNFTFSGTAFGGSVAASSISASTLTNTRVVFAGAGGLLTDDSNLTFNSGTDVLTIGGAGNLTTNGTVYSGGTITDDGVFTIDAATRVEVDSDLLPTTNLAYDLGAAGQRWDELYVRKVNIGTSTTVIEDNLFSSTTGNMVFNFAGDLQVDNHILPLSSLTYDLGSNSNRWNNIYTKDLDVSGAINTTGITISGLLAGSVVYAGSGGELKTEVGFTYDENADTLNSSKITVGIPGQTGTTATIYGDFLVIGESISGFTSQLYIEDNLIELNYNPTADTSSTSLGAGWLIQDGSGVVGTDVFFDIRGTSTGLVNRSFATNLEDIRIRETGTISSPNGKYVLASEDILDGGSY